MAVPAVVHPETGEQSSGRGVFTDAKGTKGVKVVDLPPFVKPLGPNDVILQITAACLNHRDESTMKVNLGFTPCSDAVGRVTEVGTAVTRARVGDRVCPIFFQNFVSGTGPNSGKAWPLGMKGRPGTLCQLLKLNEENIVKVPDYLTDAEASTLPCAGLTAWNGLVKEGRAKPGETLLVEGTGGVSIFGLQFAKAMGMKVICTSSSNEKLEVARSLGADEAINYKETPKWGAAAKKLGGADHVLEIGGASTLPEALKALNYYGSVAVIGLLSGTTVPLNVVQFFQNKVRMNGIQVGNREDMEVMMSFMEKHKVRPVVHSEIPLEKAQDAFSLMERGGMVGNIVVTMPAAVSKL